MSARTAADGGLDDDRDRGLDDDRDRGATCVAPSCWEPGDTVEIVGRGVEDDPILCETHRKAFLGVST